MQDVMAGWMELPVVCGAPVLGGKLGCGGHRSKLEMLPPGSPLGLSGLPGAATSVPPLAQPYGLQNNSSGIAVLGTEKGT